MLTRTAAEHGLEHAFMQVVGPLCERDLADRSSVPVVEKSRGGLLVWQQGGTQLGLAQLLVSQYVPPDSALVLSLLQQMEDEQFEADEQAAVAEVEAQAATEVDQAVRRKSEALSPTQRK